MTIHTSHPFAASGPGRDQARQFRGRLASPVTLWLSGEGPSRAGLTVSSVMVGLGESPVVVGLIDPHSELALASPETFTVTILTPGDRILADVFGGVAPAPGGEFAQADFSATDWGPVLRADRSWIGARLTDRRHLGWSDEVIAAIEHVHLSDVEPVAHVRGRYRPLADG